MAYVAASACSAQAPRAGATHLSLSQAIDLAIHGGHASLAQADATLSKAQVEVSRARAATAWEVHGQVDMREVRIDLRALGIVLPVFPVTTPVTYVGADGPYGVLDPRLKATKILIDRAAARNVQAAHLAVAEAKSLQDAEKETIAADVARVYIGALRSAQIEELRRQELSTAQGELNLIDAESEQHMTEAAQRRTAHTALNAAKQQLSAARLDEMKAVLKLQYLVGAQWSENLVLEPIAPSSASPSLEEALASAVSHNPQLAAAKQHIQTLETRQKAVSAERLPTVAANADLGGDVVMPDPSGVGGPTKSITYNAVVSLQIPIFDAHRRSLESAGLVADQHSAQSQSRDLQRQIELNTRVAFAALQQAQEQSQIARDDFKYAEDDLAEQEANRKAGNLNAVEIEQARLRHAESQDRVDATANAEALARLDLAAAIGNVSQMSW